MVQCDFRKLPDGRCRCENCGFLTEPTNHSPSRIRRPCSPTRNPSIPPIATRAANYARAVSRWQAAGRPERTDAEVDAIFRDFCSTCSLLVDGKCSACGCPVKPSKDDGTGMGRMSKALANKIRMGTERCPVGKWPVPPEPTPTPEDIEAARRIIQRGEIGQQPEHWEWTPAAREAMRQEIAATVFPTRTKPGIGRGIVILGGGDKYFGGALVLMRMLRELGCVLPIELWVRNWLEIDDRMEAIAANIEWVTIRNARTDAGGWQTKIVAIQESAFAEVLYLDSDIVPVVDPTPLFDGDGYRERGAMLWPDLQTDYGFDIERPTWAICGLPTPGDGALSDGKHHSRPTGYTPIESGQLLIDKRRCADALDVVRWLNEHSEFFYRDPKDRPYFYGDKSTFYLGFEMAAKSYSVAPAGAIWNGRQCGGITHHDEHGMIAWQHRIHPGEKVRPGKRNSADGLLVSGAFSAAVAWMESVWDGSVWRDPPAWLSYPKRDTDLPEWDAWGEIRNNHYKLPARLDGQTILDIGGHVGMFAFACAVRGAARVVSVEPNDDNYRELAGNAARMVTEAIHGAAWSSPGVLHLGINSHSGGHRIESVGQPVNAIVFDDLLRSLERVDLLKLDCEGAEWDLIARSDELLRVRQIIGEYHCFRDGETVDNWLSLLRSRGFEATAERGAPWGLFWADRSSPLSVDVD